MVVNVGQAKTDLSKLLRQVEAGEEVVIARDGVAVARLVLVESPRPGERFLASWGSMRDELAGWEKAFEEPTFTEEELDAIYNDPILPPESE